MSSNKVIIFSAPSGSGKTTIVKHLLQKFPDKLEFAISACTRDRRGRSEVHGKDYYFLTPDDFRNRIDKGEFVEWEEVYPGAFYGTLKSEVQRIWDAGKVVIADVDVKGGLNLKRYYKDKSLGVFVKVPSEKELEKRLRERNTDSEESISARLFKVRFEMGFQDRFDLSLINSDLEKTLRVAENLFLDFYEQ